MRAGQLRNAKIEIFVSSRSGQKSKLLTMGTFAPFFAVRGPASFIICSLASQPANQLHQGGLFGCVARARARSFARPRSEVSRYLEVCLAKIKPPVRRAAPRRCGMIGELFAMFLLGCLELFGAPTKQSTATLDEPIWLLVGASLLSSSSASSSSSLSTQQVSGRCALIGRFSRALCAGDLLA